MLEAAAEDQKRPVEEHHCVAGCFGIQVFTSLFPSIRHRLPGRHSYPLVVMVVGTVIKSDIAVNQI